MFSVYVATTEFRTAEMVASLKSYSDSLVVLGWADTLDKAWADCRRDIPGVLLLDDALLAENTGWIETLSRASFPIVLWALSLDPGSARRALALKAKDLISGPQWKTDLVPALERVAIPFHQRDKQDGRILAVFSSKGGVGKTTLSVNLALALAEKSHDPVLIADLDLAFGDVSAMMGLKPALTIHDVDPDNLGHSVDRIIVSSNGPVSVLPAPLAPEQAEDVQSAVLVRILQHVKADYRYVVLDLAPGYHDLNISALDVADLILTVCTPDVVTLRTISQALALFRDQFHYPDEKIRLVLNRTGSDTGIERSDILAILKTQRIYELPSAGSMPVRAANDGVPLISKEPRAPLTQAIRAVADDLEHEDAPTRGFRWPRRRKS
ncbi:AAA family ATPase [Sulfobacillus harzensis]|uniref:AAA family ATPase n=1 Tax=Sulfobacillus harzensis TaxID=2729629 RepID=A0A7Y0L6E3_9FIRM|nr:AAA family ATPase [Sulfobacillus harzensis]NMP24164.1 AAA family ATPase [Sulfobacillus harzensis]